MKKLLKIATTITIGYDDMPIELCENENFTIYIDNFTSRFVNDKYEVYKEIIQMINSNFDKSKNQILADSEMLKEFCFREK